MLICFELSYGKFCQLQSRSKGKIMRSQKRKDFIWQSRNWLQQEYLDSIRAMIMFKMTRRRNSRFDRSIDRLKVVGNQSINPRGPIDSAHFLRERGRGERRNFFDWGLQNLAKEKRELACVCVYVCVCVCVCMCMCVCVLTSFSLLSKRETLARRVGVGHGRWSPLRLLLLSSLSALSLSLSLSLSFSPVRANCRSTRTIGVNEKKKRGGLCPSIYLPSLFFRARAITLVCEGPLAIGMKVGSCVEMESPGPRLYTHLPTRARGQDRARGPPRCSSSAERGPSFSRPSLRRPSWTLCPPYLSLLVLRCLLSLSHPPTLFLAFLPPLSHPLHPLLPDLGR